MIYIFHRHYRLSSPSYTCPRSGENSRHMLENCHHRWYISIVREMRGRGRSFSSGSLLTIFRDLRNHFVSLFREVRRGAISRTQFSSPLFKRATTSQTRARARVEITRRLIYPFSRRSSNLRPSRPLSPLFCPPIIVGAAEMSRVLRANCDEFSWHDSCRRVIYIYIYFAFAAVTRGDSRAEGCKILSLSLAVGKFFPRDFARFLEFPGVLLDSGIIEFFFFFCFTNAAFLSHNT